MVTRYIKKHGPALWKIIQDAKSVTPKLPRKQLRNRSTKQSKRLQLYAPICRKFKIENPKCSGCRLIFNRPPNPTDDVQHTRGRLGELLFMVKYFKPVCRECHGFIENNPNRARELGLLCNKGDWHKIPTK